MKICRIWKPKCGKIYSPFIVTSLVLSILGLLLLLGLRSDSGLLLCHERNKLRFSDFLMAIDKKLVPCGTDGRLLFSGFQAVVTLTLTLYRVTRHTVVHQSSTYIYIPNVIEIGKLVNDGGTNARMDIPTDGPTFPPLMLVLIKMSRLNSHYWYKQLLQLLPPVIHADF